MVIRFVLTRAIDDLAQGRCRRWSGGRSSLRPQVPRSISAVSSHSDWLLSSASFAIDLYGTSSFAHCSCDRCICQLVPRRRLHFAVAGRTHLSLQGFKATFRGADKLWL